MRTIELANKVLAMAVEFNAGEVDVKNFYGAELVELCLLANKLATVESNEEVVEIAMVEFETFMSNLKEDVACKIERRSRNTFTSEEENYIIATMLNEGLAARAGIRLY